MAGLHPSLRTVSYSRLTTFESCPRQFWHAYVDRTPPDGYERIEGWMGSRVHEALEWALKETLEKRVPDPVAVLERYEAAWDAAWGPHVLVTRDDRDPDHYRALGRRCLKDHLDAEWPFLRHQPVAVEERVEFPITVGDAPSRFLGFVDRVDRTDDGRLRVVDYKTGSWVPDFKDAAASRQLALYWHGLKPRFPDASGAVLVWHYLQHGRTLRVEATPDVVAPAVQWVGATARTIQQRLAGGGRKEQFAPEPGPLCRWCPYGYTCEANPWRDAAPRPRSAANASLLDYGQDAPSKH